MARKDLLTRLADAGEEAITRLGETPGADRLLGVASSLRDRMDELQRRVRGLEELERRVSELERRLDASEGTPVAELETPLASSEQPAVDEPAPGDPATTAAGTGASVPTEPATAAERTTHSGSRAEPVGPATQGASQVGNPTDEDV